jgi:tetratricopeptide (TPR) repeat protein
MRETPIDMTRQQTRSLMATISMQVLAQNPRHPGANRYLIQSTDDPENTDIGLLAVNNLRLIDTDAAEALHIPSHYYLQHGMWEAVADSNMQAFESSMAWVEENDYSLQDLNAHNYGHLVQFANYGYLQAGNLNQAEKIRERVRSDYIASGLAAEIETPFADVYARWILDLERWQDAELLAELASEYSIRSPGLWQAIGIAAARSGNLELANEAVNLLASLSDNPASQAVNSSRQVDGLIHLAQGHNDIALGILSAAAQLNWAQPVTLLGVPPRPLKPAMETYGEALLETGDAGAALVQFQRGLTRYRGRSNVLLGAARAAEVLGRDDLVKRYYSQLAEIWQRADSSHPFISEVRTKTSR